MPRLFLGLRPPANIRAALLDAMGGVEKARWQSEAQLHLTLRFCEEVAEDRAEDLALALQSLDHPSFMLRLRGCGHFERKGMASALWIGAAPNAELERLQRACELLCRHAGLPAEPRRFVPHVTLARLNRASGPVAGWLAAHAAFEAPSWQVEHVSLFESTLSPDGSLYDEVLRQPLR